MQKKAARNKCRLRTMVGSAWILTMLISMPAGVLGDEENAGKQIPEGVAVNVQENCPEIANLIQDKKEVKKFNHKLHAEKYLIGKSAFSEYPYTDAFTCAACHIGAGNIEDITGSEKCERLSAAIEANGGAKKYKNMMHAICKNCHTSIQKAGEKSGPTKCNECHVK